MLKFHSKIIFTFFIFTSILKSEENHVVYEHYKFSIELKGEKIFFEVVGVPVGTGSGNSGEALPPRHASSFVSDVNRECQLFLACKYDKSKGLVDRIGATITVKLGKTKRVSFQLFPDDLNASKANFESTLSHFSENEKYILNLTRVKAEKP